MKYETQNTGIENMRYDFMPVGSIVPFASDIIPLGWLLCDGTPIERSRYPELYDLIGEKLPDHRGMFLRGNDNGRGIDAGRILGSEQGDAIRNITGTANSCVVGSIGDGISRGAFSKNLITNIATFVSGTLPYNNLSFDASKVVPTAEENRPKNNSVNYIIKALHIANPSMEYQVADGLNHKIETNRNTIDFNLLATLGISYGGILNNTSPKLAGVAYYDEIARKLFKCIANTSVNYADASFFEAISNNDLLFRIKNLSLENYDSVTITDLRTNVDIAHSKFNLSFLESGKYIVEVGSSGVTGSASNGTNIVSGARFQLVFYSGGTAFTETKVVINLTSNGYKLVGTTTGLAGIYLKKLKLV